MRLEREMRLRLGGSVRCWKERGGHGNCSSVMAAEDEGLGCVLRDTDESLRRLCSAGEEEGLSSLLGGQTLEGDRLVEELYVVKSGRRE